MRSASGYVVVFAAVCLCVVSAVQAAELGHTDFRGRRVPRDPLTYIGSSGFEYGARVALAQWSVTGPDADGEGGTDTNDRDGTGWGVDLAWFYCTDRDVDVRLRACYTGVTAGGGEISMAGAGVGIKYRLNSGTDWEPYMVAGLDLYLPLDVSESGADMRETGSPGMGFGFDVGGGVAYLMADTLDVRFGIQYERLFADGEATVAGESGEYSFGAFGVLVGATLHY